MMKIDSISKIDHTSWKRHEESFDVNKMQYADINDNGRKIRIYRRPGFLNVWAFFYCIWEESQSYLIPISRGFVMEDEADRILFSLSHPQLEML